MPTFYDYFSVDSRLTCKEIKDTIKPELLRRKIELSISPEFLEMRGILTNSRKRAEYDQYLLTAGFFGDIDQARNDYNQWLGRCNDEQIDSDSEGYSEEEGEIEVAEAPYCGNEESGSDWGDELEMFGGMEFEKPEGKEQLEGKEQPLPLGHDAVVDEPSHDALADNSALNIETAHTELAMVVYQPDLWVERFRSFSDTPKACVYSHSPLELESKCESRLLALMASLEVSSLVKISFDYRQLLVGFREKIQVSLNIAHSAEESEKERLILDLMEERLPAALRHRTAELAGFVFADLKDHEVYHLFDGIALLHGEKLRLGFVFEKIVSNLRHQKIKWKTVLGTKGDFSLYIANQVADFLTSELNQVLKLTDGEVEILNTFLGQVDGLKQGYEDAKQVLQLEISALFETAMLGVASSGWAELLNSGCDLDGLVTQLLGEESVSRLNELDQLVALKKELSSSLVDYLYDSPVQAELHCYFHSGSPPGQSSPRFFDHRRLSGAFESILSSSLQDYVTSQLYQSVKPNLIRKMQVEYGNKFSVALRKSVDQTSRVVRSSVLRTVM